MEESEEFNFGPENGNNLSHYEVPDISNESPGSKHTSPLRLSNANFRASRDDFSYLKSKLGQNPESAPSLTSNVDLNQTDFTNFIPSTGDMSANTSPVKYNGYQSQGEFQHRGDKRSDLDRNHQSNDVESYYSFEDSGNSRPTSPTKKLDLRDSYKSARLSIDASNKSITSMLNTSVNTETLLGHDIPEVDDIYEASSAVLPQSTTTDNMTTPIASEFDKEQFEKTPIVPNTESLSMVNGNEIFETDNSHLVEDLSAFSIDNTVSSHGDFSFTNNVPNNLTLSADNRVTSMASSIYSEMPKFSTKRATGVPTGIASIPELNEQQHGKKLTVTNNVRSAVSSIYSEMPLKNSTVESLNVVPALNNSFTNFSETKRKVSVRNHSLYQDYYNPQTGELSIKNNTVIVKSLNFAPSKVTDEGNVLGNDLEFNESTSDEDDASALFVTSLYDFNAQTLESENDSAICLSFDENELAFTYKLDDSGWGEVTLLSTLKRGWVPMNYFRSTVTENLSPNDLKKMNSAGIAGSRVPLKLLLKHAGAFLLNPHSKPVSINGELKGYTFDVESFNGMTDGIRKLLIDTDCISRSSLVVQKKPVVRRMRKKLLRGWAELIAKAKDYMGTVDSAKIEYLQLLTFQVLQKAVVFLDIWGLENDDVKDDLYHVASEELNDQKGQSNNKQLNFHIDINYLENPPFVKYRINEIYNQLISYLALISGRIDLIEHNIQGFSVMGVVVSQVNLLINEYLFIMKFVKAITPETVNSAKAKVVKNLDRSHPPIAAQLSSLDTSGEKLKILVDDMNSYVSSLHSISKRDLVDDKVDPRRQGTIKKRKDVQDKYFYSREGSAIVVSCCKMIELSSICYRILKNLMLNMDDFQLPNNRKYPNYMNMSVSPQEFIKQGTFGLLKNKKIGKQVDDFKKNVNSLTESSNNPPASKRFSMFKTGNSTDATISNDGLDFLSNIVTEDNNSSPFMKNVTQFDRDDANYDPEKEIVRGESKNLLGASFKALIYLLTDESRLPDYFFISTFFLTFRIFSTSALLLEALITRFDISNSYKQQLGSTLTEPQMRSRRQLIARTFQMWLESYWKPDTDYMLLAPLMNFFNEALKEVLPVEGYRLLVITSKLVGNPPIEHHKNSLNFNNNIDSDKQLLPRKISPKLQRKQVSRMSTMLNSNSLMQEVDTYNAFLDDIDMFELDKIDSGDKEEFDFRNSKSLNLNLELKNSGTSSSNLITSKQMSAITGIVLSYREMLGSHWLKSNENGTHKVTPVDTNTLIVSWWNTSQESWKIENYELSLLNFNGLEIAKQLTLIESKMFCSIKIGELLNQNFSTKKLHLNLSPNIQRSILFTNLLSDYVVESILRPNLTTEQRIHAFKCWLKIAISCLYLRNFNSLTSIITSLQSFLITRVKSIWDGITEKYKELYQYLASIIHPNKNYNIYREKLRDFVKSNLQENLDLPTVPYLSLFLQDLTFVVDGNPNYRNNPKSFLDEKVVNIDKYFKITKVISDLQTLQVPYMDIGELGAINNAKGVDLIRSETIKNLKSHLQIIDDSPFIDMFDIKGLPILQELILLEIWKVKQNNDREDDRSWNLSCALQPKED